MFRVQLEHEEEECIRARIIVVFQIEDPQLAALRIADAFQRRQRIEVIAHCFG